MMKNPQLEFLGDGALFAPAYGDVYYQEDGILESRHVFVDGIDLKSTAFNNPSKYRIGETGFGTGLNFVLALEAWRQAKANGILEFYSVEKFPLTPEQMNQIANERPELRDINASWLAGYEANFNNPVIEVFGDDFNLHIACGDGVEQVRNWSSKIPQTFDAWFLDGFDPSKNQDLWTNVLFESIALLSKPGAKLATFTSSGMVKRPLKRYGFECQLREGVLGKQHVTHAVYHPTSKMNDIEWQAYLNHALLGTFQKGAQDEALQLIREGAEVSDESMFFIAAQKGILQAVGHLLGDEKFCQIRDERKGESLLHSSLRSQNRSTIDYVLERFRQAQLKPWMALDSHGRNALFTCAHLRNWEFAKFLIQRGFDPSAQDQYGKSISELQRKDSPWFELLQSLN